MQLKLDDRLRVGIQTIHRRTEPATGPWLPTIDDLATFVELVDRCGYDSLWVGDHISFPVPIFDPMLQLAQAAVVSRRLTLGTGVLLLPLRHPTPVAKQVTTLDHLTEGRLILGVGVGGEFPKEYAACDGRTTNGAPVWLKAFRCCESSSAGNLSATTVGFTDRSKMCRCVLHRRRLQAGLPIWFAGRKRSAVHFGGLGGWVMGIWHM